MSTETKEQQGTFIVSMKDGNNHIVVISEPGNITYGIRINPERQNEFDAGATPIKEFMLITEKEDILTSLDIPSEKVKGTVTMKKNEESYTQVYFTEKSAACDSALRQRNGWRWWKPSTEAKNKFETMIEHVAALAV